MTVPHIFVETNFLYGAFRMPSRRDRDALELMTRFTDGQVKLFVPYLCFQEARNLIVNSLPSDRCLDLREYQRAAAALGSVPWDFQNVDRFLVAAMGEVDRTRSVYRRELADFAAKLGDGVLHSTDRAFDLLESLDLGDDFRNDRKWIIDAIILCTVLVKAKELRAAGATRLHFRSLDRVFDDAKNEKLKRYYTEVGVDFDRRFVLPDPS